MTQKKLPDGPNIHELDITGTTDLGDAIWDTDRRVAITKNSYYSKKK